MKLSSGYLFGRQIEDHWPVEEDYIFQNGMFSRKFCPTGTSLDNAITIAGTSEYDPEAGDYYGRIKWDAVNGSLSQYYGTNKCIYLIGCNQADAFQMKELEIRRNAVARSDVNQYTCAVLIPISIPANTFDGIRYYRKRYKAWGLYGMCYIPLSMRIYNISKDDKLELINDHIYNPDAAAVVASEINRQDYYATSALYRTNGKLDEINGYLWIEAGDIEQSYINYIKLYKI